MERRVVEAFRVSLFHYTAPVHDSDPVAQIIHNVQVVGYEEHGEILAVVDLLEEIQDLGADRDVERAGRLIRDNKFGVDHQRGADADTLALSSGELPGEPVRIGLVQPDQFQHLYRFCAAFRGRIHAVCQKRLLKRLDNSAPGVQAAERILKNSLHAAGKFAAVFPRALHPRHTDLTLKRDQAQHGFPQGGLSAAALSHQSEYLIPMNSQADIIEYTRHPGSGKKTGSAVLVAVGHMFDFQDLLALIFHLFPNL